MDIPDALIGGVRKGNVALFLGAGASIGAKNSKGDDIPTAKELASLLAKEFLGGTHSSDPLPIVAELSISESSLFSVQEFIRNIFDDFQPARFHKVLPTFRWRGIATTNFDLVMERAYQQCAKRAQELVPFIKNGDRVDQKMRTQSSIMLVKLHGCITCIDDEDAKLILSIDQYVTHKKGRDRLFNHVRDWGFECPIVFVGQSLKDADVRQMLLELGSTELRPRYYTVTPELTKEEQRFWEAKRITPLGGTFEQFLATLNKQISSPFRVIPRPSSSELPISEKFAVSDPALSNNCIEFLTNDVEYVRREIPTETIRPQLFYRGFSGDWSAIEQDLDVRRKLGDTILSDVFLSQDTKGSQGCHLYILKGHAGAGKSVLLRRLAYDAAVSYDKLCLFKRSHGSLSFEALTEISEVTGEHVFLFVDRVSESVPEILSIIDKCRKKLSMTMVAAERYNEWNMSCEILNPYVTEEFEVGYLSSREIDLLLTLLEEHRSLGTLRRLSLEERRQAFEKKAGRQLLVALHEATLGKPFEDIIADEYNQIKPDIAQSMYLGVCVLNRFDVPVRAGTVARVFGIRFTDFSERFFKPLEQVIFAKYHNWIHDYVYVARHPHIAQIVFDRILSSSDERLDMCLRLLSALNIDYDVDRTAYRRLIRGRILIDLFPDHGMVKRVYEVASEIAGDDAYLFHQRAVYEMNRDNGNLNEAASHLKKAHQLAPYDKTIIHSMSELEYRRAEAASTQLEMDVHLREAEKLALRLTREKDPEPHGFHTLAKIGLKRIELMIREKPPEEWSELELSQEITKAEQLIQEGLQRFPDEPYILEADSVLSELTKDETRSLEAMKKAFTLNPHNSYIAIRYAKLLIGKNQTGDALLTYRKAIEHNPNNKSLHYNYAMLLMQSENPDGRELEYHLRRAFTEGDRSYYAQFWYARQLYMNGNIPESQSRFRALRDCPMDPETKRRPRGVIIENNAPRLYSGRISKLESTYCFIMRDGTNDSVFLHTANTDEDTWGRLASNIRVRFAIGFTFHGPTAVQVHLE